MPLCIDDAMTFWYARKMKIITFLSQKGGSGKTTMAVHSAVAAQEDGERVVLVDTDIQKSATTWGQARNADSPTLVTIGAAALDDVVKAARHDAMTLCVLDTAPHAAPDAARVAKVADLIIIPCRPTAFDVAAAGAAVEIVKAAGAKAVFVLSACPFRAPEIAETRTLLKEYGLPVAPVEITDRRSFARAVATGRAVTEFDSDGKAAEEIRSLWQWIKEQMNHGNKANRTGSIHATKKPAQRARATSRAR
jgi:chromosome partitioning protein